MFERDRDFLLDMEHKTGMKLEKVQDVSYLYDTLNVERIHNLPLPDWYSPDVLAHLKEYAFKFLNDFTATPYMLQVKAGPFLTEVMENMLAVQNRDINMQPIWIYSGHDSTLVNIMKGLHIYTGQLKDIPNYGAGLIMELHQIKNQHFVEVFRFDFTLMLTVTSALSCRSFTYQEQGTMSHMRSKLQTVRNRVA